MTRLATVAAVVAAVGTLTAQPRPSPADVAQVTVIRGRVISADGNPRPLRGARLIVTGSSDEPVFTDGEGRFVARVTVPYTLRITKAGFAPAVVNGSALGSTDLQITLSPGAVLTGLVVDELGFPVADARIRARRLDPPAGDVTEVFADTDDAGEFRIGSLAGGRYALNSERQRPRLPEQPPGSNIEMELKMLESLRRSVKADPLPLSEVVNVIARPGEEAAATLVHRARAVFPADEPIAGAVGGVVLDRFGEPAEGVTVRLWQVRYSGDRSVAYPAGVPRRTDDRGQYRVFYVRPGRYLVAATDDDATSAPVYFPGMTAVANASALVIRRNEELSGINLVFSRTREARVFGLALGANGEALKGVLSLTASRRSGGVTVPPIVTNSDAAGMFEFLNVPPGEYVLRAMRFEPRLAEFGMQYVQVDGPEVPPITIAASRTATLTGRIVLEGDSRGTSPDSFLVTAVPDVDEGPVGAVSTGRQNDAGIFEMRGLAGLTRLASGSVPSGWWLKSVAIGGVNAAETPIRFAGLDDSRADVVVVFSAATGTISGRVQDERGRSIDDYRVVVFAVDRGQWFGGSPYLRTAGGPDQDGTFTVRGLPPGDYWVVAVDTLEGDGSEGEWQNPELLASLITVATRVSVGAGQRAATQHRLTRWAK